MNIVCERHPSAGYVIADHYRAVCATCGEYLCHVKPSGMLAKPPCPNGCAQPHVRLCRQVKSNGDVQVAWYCLKCERWVKDGQRLWLPHVLVKEFLQYWSTVRAGDLLPATIDQLPMVKDYTGFEPCAICGERASEYHHFMPQVFRNDPDVAPEWARWNECGAYLCPDHHKTWHMKVAPLHALAGIKRVEP